jgi:hypothetical protein
MIIVVDCDSDKIKISSNKIDIEMFCGYPYNTTKILTILLEVLSNELSLTNVSLEKIDKQIHTIIGSFSMEK